MRRELGAGSGAGKWIEAGEFRSWNLYESLEYSEYEQA